MATKTEKGGKIMEMHPKNDVNSCEQATKLPQLKKHTRTFLIFH